MAHYFIFPEKDATIYSHPDNQTTNTGIDEILTIRDLESFTDLGFYPSRFLIKFKDSEIKDVINNKSSGTPITASLNLYQTEHKELSIAQKLEVFPLAEGWENGTGRLGNEPSITNGVSWEYRDGSPNAISNDPLSTNWTTSSFSTGITASFTSDAIGGGSWYSGSGFEVMREYGYNDVLDLSFDITSPFIKFYSSSQFSSTYPAGITNNGFIIKRSGSQEFTAIDDGELNFFSMDTHTIYPPYIDISWDDSTYNVTDSTKILSSGDIYITLRNNKPSYTKTEEPKFRLNVRELYPTRTFATTSNYLDVKYLTSESYYSVLDYATEETLIPFSNTTKLSNDSEGMYFKFYMQGLQEERHYKIIFKHKNNDGIEVFDNNFYFKVVKT